MTDKPIDRRRFVETALKGALALPLGLGLAGGCAGDDTPAATPDTGVTAPPLSGRPNVVFIMVDDMGWRDLACYGGTFFETPNIDKLAREGVAFSDAYAAAPLCSPTRASVLTGKYPARLGLTSIIPAWAAGPDNPSMKAPPSDDHLDPEEITLAEALKQAGYTTGHFGKWHLGPKPHYPQNNGFDVNVGGTQAGAPLSFFYPQWKDNPPVTGKPGDYLTNRVTDEALSFIDKNREKPFFLHLSYYAVHTPIEAPKHVVYRYNKKAEKLKKGGGTTPNPTYAAMVDVLDSNVGRVMGRLKELGLDEKTLVIFFSDNGPAPGTNSAAPLRKTKGHLYEGGVRVPLIVRWPGVIKGGQVSSVPVISVDFYPTLIEAAGITRSPQLVDGVSLLPLLRGTARLRGRDLFFHFPHFSNEGGVPSGAIRSGRYKLIEFFGSGKVELYDLKTDPGEQKDISDLRPHTTGQLKARLQAWRKRVKAKMPTYAPEPAFVDGGVPDAG